MLAIRGTCFWHKMDFWFAEELSAKGADFTAINNGGHTLLMFAAESDELARVKFVIENLPGWIKGDKELFRGFVGFRNLRGKTALDYAINPEIAAYIEELLRELAHQWLRARDAPAATRAGNRYSSPVTSNSHSPSSRRRSLSRSTGISSASRNSSPRPVSSREH